MTAKVCDILGACVRIKKIMDLNVIKVIGKMFNRPLAQLLRAHAIGAEGLGFESRAAQRRQWLVTVATFLWSCVAQALSRGDEHRH